MDKDGKNMINGYGTILIDTQNDIIPSMIGPSDSSIFKNKDKEEFFTFSYYDKISKKVTFASYKLTWDDNGWPEVDLKQPMLRCNEEGGQMIAPTSLKEKSEWPEVCHERQKLLEDGTCKQCPPYTRA